MAALGTTNIGITTVRTALGETSYSLFNLGTAASINKWSRYKPIRDAGAGANWPSGPNAGDGYPKYGLNLPTNWDYLQPRGGSPGGEIDEPVRLGDFRGYEHNKSLTAPPVRLDSMSTNVNGGNFMPSVKDANVIPKDGTWLFLKNSTHLNRRLLISELGYDTYHWGVKLTSPYPETEYYKTLDNLNNSVTIPFDLKFTNPGSVTFADFPTNDTIGQWSWQVFISENSNTAWGNGTDLGTIINLPEDSYYPIISTGHFHLLEYIVFGYGSYTAITALPRAGGNFSYSATSETSGYDCGTVNTNSDSAFTVFLDGNTWINYSVWNAANDTKITDPSAWLDGCTLRIWCDANTGAPRSPDIQLRVGASSAYDFTVNQAGHPPSFNHNVHGGSWSWTVGPTASANYGDTSVYITGTPTGFYSGSGTKTMYVWIMYEGVLVSEVHTFGAKDGMAYTQWISNVDALEAGTYNIYYSDHDGSAE